MARKENARGQPTTGAVVYPASSAAAIQAPQASYEATEVKP